MDEKQILELIKNADKSDLNYFQILGTDRVQDSEKSFPPAYFDYRERWNSRLFQNKIGQFPLHVDFESTNKCNLRCSMCQIDFDTMKQGSMDMSLYKRVLKECSDNHLPSIKLNYRGEPILNRHLVEMVKLAKENGIIEVQFNSNGVAMNAQVSKELIDAGLDRVKFSIDGATQEVYEKLRKTSYQNTVDNVKKFIEIRNEKKKVRPIVHVQMVYMQDNKDEVVKYVQLWQNIVNRIGFSRYRSTERILQDKQRVEQTPTMTIPCNQLWQRLLITFDGQILMCCGDHKALNPLGNINEVSLKDIWHSDILREYRRLHLENRSGEIAACSICEINRADPKTAGNIWEKIQKDVQV